MLAMWFLTTSETPCARTDKTCLIRLAPFIFSGQMSNSMLSIGESSEITIPLTGGQEYRILACKEKLTSKINIVIYNSRNVEVYNNKDHGFVLSWDLKIGATDNFRIKLTLPSSRVTNRTLGNSAGQYDPAYGPPRCVSLLVGFKAE